MKAAVCRRYGPPNVLEIEDVEKPVPEDNEVLVRIHAATVTAGDCEIRSFKMPLWLWLPARLGFGIRGPRRRILGQELAGEIESVGKDVTGFETGDQVFAITGFSLGAYAEYITLPGKGMMERKPSNITFEEAAVIPTGGLVAVHFIKKVNLSRGTRILINGAGGSIGTVAVQIARSLGAEVTAVDRTEKLDMLVSIGSDIVVDYTKEDFSAGGQCYDVIFDVAGKRPFSASMRSLKRDGHYLLANPGIGHILRGVLASRTGGRKVVFGQPEERPGDLAYLRELIESGKVRPVIDRSYPLERVAEAHSYVETGLKRGNVAITVG
jgi:NADPH:quinone reductase-like Zn-dependent oxidoreductase